MLLSAQGKIFFSLNNFLKLKYIWYTILISSIQLSDSTVLSKGLLSKMCVLGRQADFEHRVGPCMLKYIWYTKYITQGSSQLVYVNIER